MKTEEPKDQVLYVRTTSSIKDFVSGLAEKIFGSNSRKESETVNRILEELRDNKKAEIEDL